MSTIATAAGRSGNTQAARIRPAHSRCRQRHRARLACTPRACDPDGAGRPHAPRYRRQPRRGRAGRAGLRPLTGGGRRHSGGHRAGASAARSATRTWPPRARLLDQRLAVTSGVAAVRQCDGNGIAGPARAGDAGAGRAARAAAAALALAPRAAKDTALRAGAAALRRRGRQDPRRQCPRHGRRPRQGAERRHARPAGAEPQAGRGDGRGAGDDRRARRSRRHRARPLDAAQRPRHRPRARAARAWSGSSTRAGPTSPPMPVRCASRPATPRSCAAARRASTPRARSSPRSARASPRPGLPAAAIQLVPTADRAAVGISCAWPSMST